MNFLLILAFLFFVGSLIGWVIELFFRKFFSRSNPEHKWINPGFLIGPYLPLYGFGLCALFMLAQINVSSIDNIVLQRILLFVLMSLVMTLIEYIAGLIFIKGMKVKLWDYSGIPGNIQGIICPRFSFFWAVLSAIYYFLIHPYIIDSLYWLSEHLAFSFFVGFFFGVFMIDCFYSMNILAKIRRFAADKQIVVKYERLKDYIRASKEKRKERALFVLPMRSDVSIAEHLRGYFDNELAKIQKSIKKPKKPKDK